MSVSLLLLGFLLPGEPVSECFGLGVGAKCATKSVTQLDILLGTPLPSFTASLSELLLILVFHLISFLR